MKSLYVMVPFRLKSSRFPNKILTQFQGRTLLENAISIAERTELGKVILTGPKEDYEYVRQSVDLSRFDIEFVPSSRACRSASDRLVELCEVFNDGDIFVSIPADEPLLNPDEVRRVVAQHHDGEDSIMTLYCDFFCMEDAESPLSAKIVVVEANRLAYMSRALIPATKTGLPRLEQLKKNVGVFVFNQSVLKKLNRLEEVDTFLDKIEGLEQLRWLELGFTIQVAKINHIGFGIDVPEQILSLEERALCLPLREK